MIWTIVEYVAIITECLIATRLFLLYFKLKSDDWKYLKSIILFAPLFCIFISKLMYFLVTQLILWLRRKEKYHFSTNEWIIILSAFFITLLLGFSLYMITTGGTNTDYIYIIATILLSTLDIIVFVFMR